MARTLAAEYDKLFKALHISAAQGPYAVLNRLQELVGERGVDAQRLRQRLNTQLVSETRRIISDLVDNGSAELKMRLGSLSLPSQEVFGQRIGYLRELYLDDAVKRIQGEEDDLKAAFLSRLTAWAEGEEKEIDVSDIVEKMRETAGNRARFFARDQFSKFNRSVMVASYQEAEADYVEWLTSNDQRVRDTHRERNHKIYTIPELLADPEYKSYGCRCGYAPLWHLTAEQERRRAA
jgi:SPP1 gp7 family putative phage head morphogenesis protein